MVEPPSWDQFVPRHYTSADVLAFAGAYRDQDILVTGAGGSIGSALSQALQSGQPRSLIFLEASEYSLFQLQNQLPSEFPGARCEYILGSITNASLLANLFQRFRPSIVFHAAAFKHVALLESNPFAAIENNVLGTFTLIRSALDHSVSRFVLLSTDKAVKPHSIMGASKRIAELITVSFSSASFRASAIRLCNVIASTGSVVPRWQHQLATGKPLAVTHPDAARYFLTHQQAIAAILAAGAASCDGKILLPELAPPVRIVDLANGMKTQCNEVPPLLFTGMQPGEKLSEDLIGDAESEIGRVAGPLTVLKTQTLYRSGVSSALEQLSACVSDQNLPCLLQVIRRLVPDYLPSPLLKDAARVISGAKLRTTSS